MTPAELAAHLDREAAYFRALAAKCRELTDAKDRGEFGHSPQTQSLRIACRSRHRDQPGAGRAGRLGQGHTTSRTVPATR